MFVCSDCLWKTILSEIKNNEPIKYLTIFELDASDISKNDMVEILYDMERLGYDFSDDNFHIVDGDRDITKLYMNPSLQVAIEEYFRDNNLDEEITDYDFGNGAFTEWHFYCEGDDFKYIDDNVLYDYISDLREFRDENFEVFSYGDEISVKILDDEFEESKKSARKSIRESLNFKKDYAVSVIGVPNWLKPFYWDFDEFRDDLLIASEEQEFTYYITEAIPTNYRINVEFNDGFNRRYDITFRIIPKSNKATAKELNDYLN